MRSQGERGDSVAVLADHRRTHGRDRAPSRGPRPAPSELLVSEVLGIGARSTRSLGMLIGCDAEQVVADGIVDDLARAASPPAHAALLALGAVAHGPTARRALAAARRQRLRGIAEPAWAPALETPPMLVRAIRATDPYGDVDGLALTFARHGLEERHVAVMVDHGLGGLVKDAFALDVAGLAPWLDAMSGLDITEVDVTKVAGVVIRGMELADAYPVGPPIDDDYWATRALLAIWIRALPGGVDTSAPRAGGGPRRRGPPPPHPPRRSGRSRAARR